ncbi:hypothetical protein M409DRAFT_28010 [Zasmidium cellare ATCC 36951]|uniref:Pex19-domain-containing protein n=1 Tax=Zasmidium cellare ATCC 36951 TaxID=1080233 RepID=A0A6A6C872_ZASCE|nr:uncharacterized protein M409DRAFT_28010 [Zasmidium cellare ATCC 36951]KAF2161616.1 hypothetical protein M409DRAFT_28010 [Zasmidium cellare ATCC 36951]
MAEKVPEKINPETAPDPDEDDLDDLDDVLDEFQATSISEKAKPTSSTAPAASGPGRPTTSDDASQPAADLSEEDFAKQLQSGMTSLISELDSNPEMQQEFEKMMQELIAAGAAGTDQQAGEHLKQAAEAVPKAPTADESSKPKTAAASSKKGSAGGDDFQDTIRRTMQRMQASDSGATAASTAPQSEEDVLAQMMKELTEGGGGMGGGGEDFNAMLMSMMAHLTNKEILYEPMKELSDKFPAWLEKNREKTPKDELERYEKQRQLVGEIVARFEKRGYSDDNEEDREYIVERMQEMQSQGSPPSDLVGDMSAAQDALGDLESGCPTQ